tara:strand:- start:777 stop:1592 length:816 start_codon:yes stop_codon:yes gene_type:complete
MVDHDMGAIRGLPKDLLDASRKILEDEPVEVGKNVRPAGLHFPEPEKKEEELVEGTWAFPSNSREIKKAKDFMKKPFALGKNGDDASSALYDIFGDDDLHDALVAAGKKNPKGDARVVVQKWLKKFASKEFSKPSDSKDVKNVAKQLGIKEGAEKHSTGDKESYRDFVNKALKKFGVDSPAELSPEKKKEFYNYLDKNWIGDHEKDDPKAEAKDNEKEDQVHAPKKALEPMSTPNDENGKNKKKMKPEKVNTKPSMKGEEQSKRPLLVRER